MAEKRVKLRAAKDVTGSDKQPTGKNKQIFGRYTMSEFPEEILDRIFFQLSDPRDLLGISNATPQFRRILQPKIPKWSFGEVFPLIYSKIDKNDIFNCRLVCKDWSNAVENFVQTHPVSRALEPYPYHPAKKLNDNKMPGKNAPPVPPSHSLQYMPSLLNKGLDGIHFPDSEAIELFLKNTKSHPRNPFLLRYLDLSNSLWEDPVADLYWKHADVLLAQLGHHITQVHLGPNEDDDDRNVVFICYKVLRNCLLKLPNLRVLTIGGFYCHSCVHPGDQEKLDELRNYVAEHPLPELPCLETLDSTIPVNHRTYPVLDELMTRYSGQLKKVFITLSMWTEEDNDMFNFSNLTELQVGVDDELPEFQNFTRRIQAPNVRKLHSVFRDRFRICPVLESFQADFPSLEYLKLRFNTRPDDFVPEAPSKSSFNNIKTLEVFDNDFVPYGVILRHLTDLEYILITADPDNRVETERLSTFRRELYNGKIYDSDIWTLLKDLKELTFAWLGKEEQMLEIVGKKVYTREMHNYLKKQAEVKSEEPVVVVAKKEEE